MENVHAACGPMSIVDSYKATRVGVGVTERSFFPYFDVVSDPNVKAKFLSTYFLRFDDKRFFLPFVVSCF